MLASASADGIKSRDILGRIKVGDIEGAAALAQIDRKRATQLARKFNESVSEIEERKILRTSDSRKLERETVAIIAEGASSKLARSRLLLLTPSLNLRVIGERLGACVQGKQIYDELMQSGRLDEMRKVLEGGLSFEIVSQGKKKTSVDSETIRYFLARKRPTRAVMDILTGFANLRGLAAFFELVDRDALDDTLKILQSIEAAGVKDFESVVSDSEMLINEKLRSERGLDEDHARRIVEDGVDDAVASLNLSPDEESGLRKSAFEALSIPFEFDRASLRRVAQMWNERQEKEREARASRIESTLKRHLEAVEYAVERAVLLDQLLAVALAMERYSLVVPQIGSDGMSFVDGRNLFLSKEHLEGKLGEIQPVSYSIGRTHLVEGVTKKARYVVMLTGANSGGKTTLLTTVAMIHILALLGLPVPCRVVEVAPLPVYLFRRRVTKKVGSLEQAMNSLIPVFAERHRKLILMDEFEALTEPGAAGRILATIMNEAATSSSLVLLVTHLARETLPYVKLPIRVDGIEASGLNKEGELTVDRQPKFNHIGSSTPKLIVMKLAQSAKKKNVQTLYKSILNSLESETMPVQTPLTLPWLADASEEGIEGK